MSIEERRALVARRDPDRVRAADRARYARHSEARKGRMRRSTTAVSNALRAGRLVREPCLFCDATPAQAHHHDYDRPLDVTWLCPGHHALIHARPST